MGISKVTGSATTATSGTTVTSSSLTVQVGDILCFGVAENPSTDTITFTKSAGTGAIGAITAFTRVTNGSVGLTVGWCAVTKAGTVTIRGTSSGTITAAVLVVEAYRGALSVVNQTSTTNSIGTDEALTVSYSNNLSWVVLFVGLFTNAGLVAGANQVLEQATTAGTTTGVSGYLGSNESALSGAPSTLAVHATAGTTALAAVLVGFQLTASVEDNQDYVPRFYPSVFNKACFVSLRQGDDFIIPPTPETNRDFVATFASTRFFKAGFAKLRQGDNHDFPLEYQTAQVGQYRIQNNSAAGYLVYIGVNCIPDFTQPAQGFSASLPVNVAWPLPGSGLQSLYVVPRYRDTYGCISQNSYPWVIVLSPTGQIRNPVQAPINISGVALSSSAMLIAGEYPSLSLDQFPADTIRVWVSTTNPPDTSGVPTFQGTVLNTPFTITGGSFVPGTYYAAVSLYRTVDGVVSGPVVVTVVFPVIPNGPQAVFTADVTPT